MTSAAFSFLVACAVAAALTPLVKSLAERAGLVDAGDGVVRVHGRGLPRLGGVAVAIAFYTPLVAIFVLKAGVTVHFQHDLQRLVVFALGGLAIFALGLWDDLRGLGATLKFTVEVAVAVSIWWAGFRIEHVTVPGFGYVDLGPLSLPVTVLWIVGITNALNLVDGLDGLAAGVAFFAGVSNVIVGAIDGDVLLVLFSCALTGAVLGFLPYNFNPARIFIGDSGSLFLGYVLALTSIYSATHKSSTAVAVLGPILILGLPIMDTGLAVLRRARRRAPLFDGDREHVHHRLIGLGLSHRRSVGLLYGLCAAFALAGLVATASSRRTTALALVSLLAILVVFERRLGFLRQGVAASGDTTDRSLVELVRAFGDELRRAPTMETLWEAVVDHAEELGFQRARLLVSQASGSAQSWEWSRPGIPPRLREAAIRLTIPVSRDGPAGPRLGVLEIDKRPVRKGAAVADDLLAALIEVYARNSQAAELAMLTAAPASINAVRPTQGAARPRQPEGAEAG